MVNINYLLSTESLFLSKYRMRSLNIGYIRRFAAIDFGSQNHALNNMK